MSDFGSILKNGIWKENPVLVLALGMCPTLATTSNASNALAMGIATLFVLVCSNMVISCIRKIVPDKIRIPVFIVVIAAFVSVADMLMQAYAPPQIYHALGIFLPLITVNCIVLGRAEAFASKNGVLKSCADGLGMGLGFMLALTLLGALREILSAGTLFHVGLSCWPPGTGFAVMGQAPGGFILLGFILAGMNLLNIRRAEKAGLFYDIPQELDCRHCSICSLDKRLKTNDGEVKQ